MKLRDNKRCLSLGWLKTVLLIFSFNLIIMLVVDLRVENLRNAGVDVEYRRYESAGHGFGLGTGTDADGWLDLAVQFWKRHITER